MRAKMIGGLVGLAVALSLVCLAAWLFLVVALFEHEVWHPLASTGLDHGVQSPLLKTTVIVLFWAMPLWIVLFGQRLRVHWRSGKSGLVPALLMNASAVPVLGAMSMLLLSSSD
jgi:hypothetical protein